MSKSKNAIVTGAGSGVGRAATLALLRDGWNVTLAGRRIDALTETIQLAGVGADRAIAVATNVADPASVKALFAAAAQKFGRLDMIFNNAGINAPGIPLEDLAIEKWREVVDTNLSGVFWCIQEAFRVMKAQDPQGGRIINNGSLSAHVPRPGSIPYTATKHAVTGLTKTAALDGRKYNIAVSQIDIGNAATEMTLRMAKGVPQADGRIAVEPQMDVNHVGDAIVQIANFPLETNVQFMTIMATKMPFIGRG